MMVDLVHALQLDILDKQLGLDPLGTLALALLNHAPLRAVLDLPADLVLAL